MVDPLKKIEQKTLHAFIPLRAIIELTYRCNFGCVHCYCKQPASSSAELSTAEIKDILCQLAGSGTLMLTLTGGEVLLRTDFLEIARYASQLRFAQRWCTNGSGWDKKMIRKAQELRPLSVDISLYGSCPEIYEAVTGDGNNFSRTISGIRNLKNQGIPVVLKLPVLKENYEDLSGMIDLCKELEVFYTMSANITPRDDGSSEPLEHEIPLSLCGDFLSQYGRNASPERRHPNDYLCNTARNLAVISPYGDVFPCVQIKKSVGNLRENEFRSIWSQSPLLGRLRQLRVRDLQECTGCSYLDGCTCCPGISWWESGSFVARDHRACHWTRLRADLGLVISKNKE